MAKKKPDPGNELALHLWCWFWAVPCVIAGIPMIGRGAMAATKLADYAPLQGALFGVGFLLSATPVLLVAAAPVLIYWLVHFIRARRLM